ncbi:MAG: 2-phospho-L-lactate transferase [Ardenticatenaceae bacterium]|nr:2-phospho-L-lactate transferase [Ardenticatenaceae bacterium]MCB9446321.1 2-phospho-L-lactate transferase [Ardenticatenaceae bacterium]
MNKLDFSSHKIVCLAGGVGGAKLADGLAQIVPPQNLTIIVNTGDDFEHLGLTICPDLDTVMYTLGGVANPGTGWGRAGESWRTMEAVKQLAGPDWFSLGDVDLATHLVRTQMLKDGETLTAVTRHLCRQFNIQPDVLPMSDWPAPTLIETDDGTLPFQAWFVKERWQPPVKQVVLPEDVRATPAVLKALENADLVLIAPSNPFVSVAPILNVYPIRAMLEDIPQTVVAVTPIIGGQAVKGPAAKMMAEMDLPVTARAVAQYYGDLIDGFVFDGQDAGSLEGLSAAQLCTDTWMHSPVDRARLAQDVLTFAMQLAGSE